MFFFQQVLLQNQDRNEVMILFLSHNIICRETNVHTIEVTAILRTNHFTTVLTVTFQQMKNACYNVTSHAEMDERRQRCDRHKVCGCYQPRTPMWQMEHCRAGHLHQLHCGPRISRLHSWHITANSATATTSYNHNFSTVNYADKRHVSTSSKTA